jgi:hypothetical protein
VHGSMQSCLAENGRSVKLIALGSKDPRRMEDLIGPPAVPQLLAPTARCSWSIAATLDQRRVLACCCRLACVMWQ